MIKLFTPVRETEFSGLHLKLDNNRIINTRTKTVFFTSIIDEKTAEWCLPHFGPLVNVNDQYLLLYSACEHSRGASMHNHKIECLDPKGKLLFTEHGHYTTQAVLQIPDSNKRLENLYLLHFINGLYAYNHIVNKGRPCLEIVQLHLPGGNKSNRWIVGIPEKLKNQYDSENIYYLNAALIKKKDGIYVHCFPVTKTQTDLSFFEKIPYT